jgi:hypothetical protein
MPPPPAASGAWVEDVDDTDDAGEEVLILEDVVEELRDVVEEVVDRELVEDRVVGRELVLPVEVFDPVLDPTVIGVAMVDGRTVKGTDWVVSTRVESRPVAEAATVVAKSDAVPHPNCEKPPAKEFL